MKSAITLLFLAQCSLACSQTSSTTGEIRGPFLLTSKIYPGTERNYWVYVPRQYDPAKPACTMVVQDGLSRATGWNLPAVLDSLIALKKIPIILGIFVDHGKVAASSADNFPRFNRSVEYDALGDRYARFLVEELLPEVGRSFNLSTDPNDRSIAGASSGAICAFNAAWERPDQFRRVLSTIGTYVGLRGGDEFATLVRETESKPIRVYLEDGTQDLNIYGGDWYMANLNMLSALTWAGYEVNHAWGEGGGHDSKHAITILADALVWLWKDYPSPVQAHKSMNTRLNLLVDGETWKEIPLPQGQAERIAVNGKGEVFFTGNQGIYTLDQADKASLFVPFNGKVGGLSFYQDGKLYVGDTDQHTIVAFDDNGVRSNVATHVDAQYLTISGKGIYFAGTTKDRIGFYSFLKKEVRYFALGWRPAGLTLSAEQTFLSVSGGHVFGHSFKIADDGNLDFGQDYIHYQIPYGSSTPGAAGMTVDSENIHYTATAMGIQASDQLGRVNFVFSKPWPGAADVKLGGAGFNRLFVTCQGKLFARKVNAKGVLSWLPGVKPPKPGL